MHMHGYVRFFVSLNNVFRYHEKPNGMRIQVLILLINITNSLTPTGVYHWQKGQTKKKKIQFLNLVKFHHLLCLMLNSKIQKKIQK